MCWILTHTTVITKARVTLNCDLITNDRLCNIKPGCLPAVNADWSILAKLLLGFVHLANEIDEALPRFGHTLLWPISELELTHCS